MPESGFGQGGRRQGQGRGQGQDAGGRMGGQRRGAGPSGSCVCPSCGTKVPHKQGNPCYQQKCPQCGTMMIRE